MKALRLWWKYVMRERLRRLEERAVMAVAWALPRRLAYWCAIRVGAHATQGAYTTQVVPDLTLMDALQRWDG